MANEKYGNRFVYKNAHAVYSYAKVSALTRIIFLIFFFEGYPKIQKNYLISNNLT